VAGTNGLSGTDRSHGYDGDGKARGKRKKGSKYAHWNFLNGWAWHLTDATALSTWAIVLL
jgi:hypothetical protein